MLKTFHKSLLKLPPELSHDIAKKYLIVHGLKLKKTENEAHLEIKRENHSIHVVNRVGLAAGFDKNAEMFHSLASLGFGFVEVGTVTPNPQPGNSKPRLWRIPGKALVNHMGFNSVGSFQFKQNIEKLKPKMKAPLWVNIGKNRSTPNEEAHEDYCSLFEDLKSVADAFVVNLSSPNTPGLLKLQNEDFLKKILQKAPALPLFLKLSPDLQNKELSEMCEWIKDQNQIYGVILTNTSRNIALKMTRHENGGLSGPPLFERSLECVMLAREVFKDSKIIVGVGGIDSLEKAQAMRKAGADLVEIYTSFIYNGIKFVKELSEELS